MGTGNFYNKNASKIFAFHTEEEFDYIDNVSNIQESLQEKGFDDEDEYEDGLRSFPGKYISSKAVSRDFYGVEIIVTIKAVCRSGYYSGCNVDWELEYQCEGIKTDEELTADDIAEEMERYYDIKRGMAVIQSRNAVKYMDKASQKLVDELETVLTEATEPLIVVARFSNGETIYEKADNKKAELKAIANGFVI